MLDRSDPTHKEYMQGLADINYILWCLHRERMESSTSINLPGFDQHNLALLLDKGSWEVEFPRPDLSKRLNVREEAELITQVHDMDRYPILDALIISLRYPYSNFMREVWRITHNVSLARSGKMEVNDIKTAACIFSDYFFDLYTRVTSIGNDPEYPVRRPRNPELLVEDQINAGNNTGTEIVVNLLIMEKLYANHGFDAELASLLISKTDLPQLGEIRTRAQLSEILFGVHRELDKEMSAYKIDDHKLVVNIELLKANGYGMAVGCPASLPPSREALQFCGEMGITARGRTMLADLVNYARPLVDEVLFREPFEKDVLEKIKSGDIYRLSGDNSRLPSGKGVCPLSPYNK